MSQEEIIKELMETLNAVAGSLKVIYTASPDAGAKNLADESLHWIFDTYKKIHNSTKKGA